MLLSAFTLFLIAYKWVF